MARLTFWGAAGTVTGSRHVLEVDGKKLLIDCGLFQGSKENRLRNWEPFPISPAEFQQVLITHAHIDHIGYLPRFCREGFAGSIHCTHGTFDLAEILLRDSAHIQEEDAAWANKKGFSRHKPALPLYTSEDAEKALSFFWPVNYGEDIFIGERIQVKFKDAGHILGSTFIDLRVGQRQSRKKIVFSGDLGRAERPILRDPVQAFEVDYLVLESTYGDRLHPDGDAVASLSEVINRSVQRGGVLLVPAFAVGRTQTLLYVIRQLEEEKRIPTLPVFVDSPMAIDATAVFQKRMSDQDLASRILMLQGKKVFRPGNLRFCKTRDESKAINKVKGPAIIISASGMATGGRILHHLVERLPKPQNTILFIGYQASGTRGRTILEGNPTVKIHGRQIPVKAKIENFSGYSGHADYNEILAWLMGFNRPPRKTFLVHGEPEAAASLAEKIRSRFGWEVEIPKHGESFDIDLD